MKVRLKQYILLLIYLAVYKTQDNEIIFSGLILWSKEHDLEDRGNTAENVMYANFMPCRPEHIKHRRESFIEIC